MINELELRAQAAYGHVSQLLMKTIDEVANLRAELAARDAQMKAAQDKIAALEVQLVTQAKSDTEAL
jgi:septal ring factor EnvC (AmiA/AmiB activator)